MRRLLLLVLVVATVVAGLVATGRVDGGTVSMPFPGQHADDGGEGSSAGGGDGGASEDQAGRLDPGLERAFLKAQSAATAAGVELTVTSGWRSAAHQQELFDEAVAKYGSAEVARQWVLPPAESAHVRGDAIDVGPPAGADWLRGNGVRFGLCQRYANESWHFERLAPALGQDCPTLEPHA